MNTDKTLNTLKSLPPEQVQDIAGALGSLVSTAVLLTRASKASKRGDYAKATYYAVLWGVVQSNYNFASSLRNQQRQSRKLVSF